MSDAPRITVEEYAFYQRWAAADRIKDLITRGITQVTFAEAGSGFTVSYPTAAVPPAGASA